MDALLLYTQGLVAAEALAAIAAWVTYSKWINSYLKWFPFYLSVIVGCEICYHTLSYFHQISEARMVYEFVVPFEIFFILWFFYQALGSGFKRICIWACLFYVLAWLLEKTLLVGLDYYFLSISYTVGNLFILICIILYFIELTGSETFLGFKRQIVFWIVCGMLIFYVGTFPFYGLYNELSKNLDIFYPVVWVATSLNYCMYLFFTIAFVYGKSRSD